MGRAQTRRKGARSGSWSSSRRVLRILVGVTRPPGVPSVPPPVPAWTTSAPCIILAKNQQVAGVRCQYDDM